MFFIKTQILAQTDSNQKELTNAFPPEERSNYIKGPVSHVAISLIYRHKYLLHFTGIYIHTHIALSKDS